MQPDERIVNYLESIPTTSETTKTISDKMRMIFPLRRVSQSPRMPRRLSRKGTMIEAATRSGSNGQRKVQFCHNPLSAKYESENPLPSKIHPGIISLGLGRETIKATSNTPPTTSSIGQMCPNTLHPKIPLTHSISMLAITIPATEERTARLTF